MFQILAEGVIDLAKSEWFDFYGKKTANIKLINTTGEFGGTRIIVYSIDDYGWRANKEYADVDLNEAEADFFDYLEHLKGTNGATMKDFSEFFSPKGWEIDWLC